MEAQEMGHLAMHLFTDRTQAQAAVRALENHAFTPDHIQVVMPAPPTDGPGDDQETALDPGPFGDGTAGATLAYLTPTGVLLGPDGGESRASGALAGWGMAAGDAPAYVERIGKGAILVIVRAGGPERLALARRLLHSADLGPAGHSTETRLSPPA